MRAWRLFIHKVFAFAKPSLAGRFIHRITFYAELIIGNPNGATLTAL